MFETLVDRLYNIGVYDVKVVENLVDEDSKTDIEISSKDTLTLLNEYIDEVEMSVDKSDLKSLMRTLYIESNASDHVYRNPRRSSRWRILCLRSR